MRQSLPIFAAMTVLCGCSALSGNSASNKTDGQANGVVVKHIDLSCAPTFGRDAGPYGEVNRISIDLVNNRIDLFSKAQMWQFHANGDKKAGSAPYFQIAYVGRDIAAWGMNARTPFSFYFSPAKSSVAMTYISAGEPNAVTFKCS